MQLKMLSTDEFRAFSQTLRELEQDPQVQSLLIFLPEGNAWSDADLNAELQRFSKPVIGGIFPQIIFQQQCHTKGALFIGSPTRWDITTVAFSEQQSSEQLVATLLSQYQDNTLLVISDGLAPRMTILIDELFNHFGLSINFVGGGAGSLTLQQRPCVITNQGLQQGTAAMALLHCQSGIGVAHGWQSITDAYRVTESIGNQIISLNWQPAFEVYQQVIAEHSQQPIRSDNFFHLAKSYPFGLTKLGNEFVIRDPITTENNRLICIGDVPVGSFVHVMHGDVINLPKAAADAAVGAKSKAQQVFTKTDTIDVQLFIDCIARVLFLAEDFSTKLANAAVRNLPMVGALTLGEIANSGQDYLEIYNKTPVVALLKGF